MVPSHPHALQEIVFSSSDPAISRTICKGGIHDVYDQ